MGRERDLKIEENKPNSISVPWRFYRCIVFSSALLKNLDGLLKRLHQGKGQRVGWLPNFLPAFQQMKSAIFFIAQSSPINSLTSAEEGVAGGISQGGCPRVPATARTASSVPWHKCVRPFRSTQNGFQRHGKRGSRRDPT